MQNVSWMQFLSIQVSLQFLNYFLSKFLQFF